MKTTSAPVAPTAKNAKAPEHRVTNFRLGRIQAAVWQNVSNDKTFFNVTFTRSYQDEKKVYHDTDSFGRDDLPLVAKLADMAHTFIYDRLAALKKEDAASE